MSFEEVALDNIQHLFHLAENQNSVLRKRSGAFGGCVQQFCPVGINGRNLRTTDSTILQNLPEVLLSKQKIIETSKMMLTHFNANNFGACWISLRLVDALPRWMKADSMASVLDLRTRAG